MNQRYSKNCKDETKRWDRQSRTCVPCHPEPLLPGYEVNPNCGFDDNGGRHVPSVRGCGGNTFNNGSWAKCRQCSPCSAGYTAELPCNSTRDTQCKDARPSPAVPTDSRIKTTQGSFSKPAATTVSTAIDTTLGDPASSDIFWIVPCFVLIFILLAVIYASIIYLKMKRGQCTVWSFSRKLSLRSPGFSPLSSPACNNDLKDIVSPEIVSAPLQTVMDNLDVLEQLVILLDPDSLAVKNTRHLASNCGFSSAWITYTYSMKDSKSPLKAVLEGVISRQPDWTVGHLAKLLRQMDRNDAVAVLAQLRLNEMAV
ncbi:IGF-like family receptor 1 isoform X2 [Echeneis naucrates]|uniref:TNFR-Cys domain-containing protein n=1 Tax=Echeneis naucrates TaxID=173247 RepID=A0A665W4I5_ECHNA|nr:IGF-like family receptor 1 isoform X2 [Echeneis naucrates]